MLVTLAGLALVAVPRTLAADETEALRKRVAELEAEARSQQEKIEVLAERLEQVVEQLEAGRPEPESGAPVAATDEGQAAPLPPEPEIADEHEHAERETHVDDDLYQRDIGRTKFRVFRPAFSLLATAGGSTASEFDISRLEGGAHDPKRQGFTFQEAEFTLVAAMDPYVTGTAIVAATETGLELEEGFATTRVLHPTTQLRGGYYNTDFGLVNPVHPHDWEWVDQPVIATRILGGEGERSVGTDFQWSMFDQQRFDSQLSFGIQNADNNNLSPSFFAAQGVGGRPSVTREVDSAADLLYSVRAQGGVHLGESFGAELGLSGLFGPNSTGPGSRTYVAGADLSLAWESPKACAGGFSRFVLWQTEAMYRHYEAAAYDPTGGAPPPVDPGCICHGDHYHGPPVCQEICFGPTDPIAGAPLPADVLLDWGVYSQVVWGFHRSWRLGLRYEYADSDGPSYDRDGNVVTDSDFRRTLRHRVSPVLSFVPTPWSRLRLQFNYDNSRFLPEDAYTVWLNFALLFGEHRHDDPLGHSVEHDAEQIVGDDKQ